MKLKKCIFLASAAAMLMSCGASLNAAEPLPEKPVVLEFNFYGGGLFGGGNALNSPPPVDINPEIEDFPLIGGVTTLAVPFGRDFLAQFELAGEVPFHKQSVGGVDATDTYAGAMSAGGHLAYVADPFLLGLIGGGGKTTNAEGDAHTEHWFIGGEARHLAEYGSIALQAGYLDSSAADPEMISDAGFVRGIGQLFFNDNRNMAQADITYLTGVQDPDAGELHDEVEVLAWGIMLEHVLDADLGGLTPAIHLSYQGASIVEDRNSGSDHKLIDHAILAGFKIRFGAGSTYARARHTAPNLPNFGRWMGATPAVD